jgi:casein kinase II subunit beta
MQWLRLRPEDAEDLDAVDWRGRWIDDDDDGYDDDLEEDVDRPMEDFDPVCSDIIWSDREEVTCFG